MKTHKELFARMRIPMHLQAISCEKFFAATAPPAAKAPLFCSAAFSGGPFLAPQTRTRLFLPGSGCPPD